MVSEHAQWVSATLSAQANTGNFRFIVQKLRQEYAHEQNFCCQKVCACAHSRCDFWTRVKSMVTMETTSTQPHRKEGNPVPTPDGVKRAAETTIISLDMCNCIGCTQGRGIHS